MGGTRSEDNVPTGHSTQKPVRLFEIPIGNHTKAGEVVYDPFVGSGTTLIAAEKMNRVAFVMDIDPRYVQVTVTRWQQFTGKRAKPSREAVEGEGRAARTRRQRRHEPQSSGSRNCVMETSWRVGRSIARHQPAGRK
jgi:DNA modification methylase